MEIYHQTTIKVLPQAVKAGVGVLCIRNGNPRWAHVLLGTVPPCHPHIPESRLEKCRDGISPSPTNLQLSGVSLAALQTAKAT